MKTNKWLLVAFFTTSFLTGFFGYQTLIFSDDIKEIRHEKEALEKKLEKSEQDLKIALASNEEAETLISEYKYQLKALNDTMNVVLQRLRENGIH